ncbi:MAG TPA: hypothetical protein VGJ72_15820 [Polaromonas sp.]
MNSKAHNAAGEKHEWARLARQTLVCALCFGFLTTAAADPGVGKLAVSATVLKRTTMKVVAQPASVTVTAGDIARGYVEVPTPVQVAIQSNSPTGYVLEFGSRDNFMQQIRVTGLDSEVQLGSAGGVVTQAAPGRGMRNTTLSLGFRFMLSETARQGVYPWPVQLAAASL